MSRIHIDNRPTITPPRLDRREVRGIRRRVRARFGWCYELRGANRRGGPMYWGAADLAAIGPVVRVREIRADGTRGRYETLALALSPARYMAAVNESGR